MTRPRLLPLFATFLGAAAFAAFTHAPLAAQDVSQQQPDPYLWNDRAPDARFKADILVVVAHPDDETMVTAYLAREIYDQHKRVAVVFGTHGDGGNNDIGPEQALAMGQIREIEGRTAVGSLGITNVWWLTGHDTYTQDVLASLEHWGHGACLDELVRIVRLTRPDVILTFLPDFTTGENHGDHQAAGVLATEAFDLAGDPTKFAEQVSPAINPDKNPNFTEGLRPWQPQKLYYFYNPTHDIFAGRGPQYSTTDISPSRHESYGMLAAQAFAHHRTQGGDRVTEAINNHTLETSRDEGSQLVTEPVKLIFGKSLVPSGITDDVFTGVEPAGIPFHPAPGFIPAENPTVTMTIGDPWNFYHRFWKAHGLDHLDGIVPLEVTVKVGTTLSIPLVIDNATGSPVDVKLSVQPPAGWNVLPTPPFSVDPHTHYFVRVRADAPATKLEGWQQFTVSAESGERNIGTVPIRAQLSTGWVAPQ